jgi:hypothetical protein
VDYDNCLRDEYKLLARSRVTGWPSWKGFGVAYGIASGFLRARRDRVATRLWGSDFNELALTGFQAGFEDG